MKTLNFCDSSWAVVEALAAKQGCSYGAALRSLLLQLAPSVGVTVDEADLRVQRLAELVPASERKRIESHLRAYSREGMRIGAKMQADLRAWGATDELLEGLV